MSVAAKTRRVPAQERSRRTVRRIVDAAEAIVAEHGVDAATTRAISERANVTAPSLYRFFADRDEVLDTLLVRLVGDLDERSRTAEATWSPAGGEDLVRLEMDLAVDYFQSHPSLSALWFGGRASAPVVESVRERNRALAARVGTLAKDRGFVREDTPPAAFEMLVELGDRVLQLAFRDGAEPDREVVELGCQALTAFLARWAPE